MDKTRRTSGPSSYLTTRSAELEDPELREGCFDRDALAVLDRLPLLGLKPSPINVGITTSYSKEGCVSLNSPSQIDLADIRKVVVRGCYKSRRLVLSAALAGYAWGWVIWSCHCSHTLLLR